MLNPQIITPPLVIDPGYRIRLPRPRRLTVGPQEDIAVLPAVVS
jgi:hypothetical protein